MKLLETKAQVVSSLRRSPSPMPAGAFTLLELLVLVAMLLMLGALFLPALAGMRPASRAFQCMNNARQIAGAVLMYTGDYSQFFPPNPDDGTTQQGYTWCAGEAGGGTPDSPAGSDGTFNPNILQDPRYSLLASFLGTNASPFRCPSDPRMGPLHGIDVPTALNGRLVPAARSISMNCAVGTVDPGFINAGFHSGAPTRPTNGPWLTGDHSNWHNSPWDTFGTTTDFQQVSPGQIFLTADEDQHSLNDAVMEVSAGSQKWIDWPGTYHNRGAVFSFCDGHAELHQWQGSVVVLSGPLGGLQSVPSSGPDFIDWAWMRDHTTIHQ